MRRRIVALLTTFLAFGAAAQERIEFPSTDGHLNGGAPTRLLGLMRKPDKGDGPFPAIVGLHGCAGLFNEQGRERGVQRQWGRLLAAEGYIVLMVDSFGPRGFGYVCGTGERAVSGSGVRPYDALGAYNYLRARGDVRADRVGLIGWSHGGGATVHAMRAEFAPSAAEGYFRAAAAFYPGECSASSLGEYRVAAPLIVLIGEKDNWTPPGPCRGVMLRAEARGEAVEFVLYPDAVHGFDAENQPITALTGIARPGRPAPFIGTNIPARDDSRLRVKAMFEHYLKAK